MLHRPLGTSGPQVSLLGLGCNNFGGRMTFEATERTVHKALDLGITLFDTSDSYGNRGGSEEALGRILGSRRKDIVLATKFGTQMDDEGKLKGASRGYIMMAVEASLRRLKTDWIDLYQIHYPDPATPIEETLEALDVLVRQGKVRHIGCSNFSGAQLDEAAEVSARRDFAAFVSCQNEYSLLDRRIERDLAPAMARHGVGFLPFFPLASGLLSGKYKHGAPPPAGTRLATMGNLADRYLTEANWKIVGKLQEFCDQRGHSLLELAFSWLAARPGLSSVIAGATSPEQLEQNLHALGWQLTAEEIAEIDRITAA